MSGLVFSRIWQDEDRWFPCGGMANKKILKKLTVVTIVVGVIAVFKILGLGQYFTLAYMKASQARFSSLYADHRLMVIVAYMVIYILVTSLSLPGAVIMTLACAVSRFVLREWVQKKFGDKLKAVNEGIEREGAFYLFTLRLIPIFPFWLINIVMGLTRMPLRTFYWVSQAGMLAGTIVYVNAGKELAKIESVGGYFRQG
ncbi:conserved membrane hypothetical protein [Candidatus Sulfobium mesophilum]|uniref:TVP38/TMEM64 family membrane protein n=1 Tax=Candidatus Sulfobium mesophilum TaxID=2016548 RepID=A0A2U3QJQ9_9BACT|nr:conserved membrane hypothetical protein [Candidatus Sulfobium mesophilum]